MELQKLTVPLVLDSGKFDSGLDKAIGGLKKLAGVAVAAYAIKKTAEAITDAVKATFDWAEELDNLGDKLGGTTEELAAYAYAARVSGVSSETFAKANVILEKGLVTATGRLDTVGKALKTYGINVKDSNGKVKTQAQLTQEIANKYGKLATQQEKVNFLTEIYGRNGAELIDFFDVLNSEGGVGTLAEKMKSLGLAIDPGRYEEFNRNLERLKMMGLAISVAFTEKVMPTLEHFLGWIADLRSKSPKEIFDSMRDGFLNFARDFDIWAGKTDWKGLSKRLVDNIKSIDWKTVGTSIRVGLGEIFHGIGEIASQIDWGGLFRAGLDAVVGTMAGLLQSNLTTWDEVWAVWKSNWEQAKQIFNAGVEQLRLKWIDFAGGAITVFLQFVSVVLTGAINILKGLQGVITFWGILNGQDTSQIRGQMDELIGSLTTANEKVNSTISSLKRLNGMHSDAYVDVWITQHGGSMGATLNPATGAYTPTQKITPFATGSGGWQTVPAGYPNDTYLMALSSGEKFNVVPKGQQDASGGITLYNYGNISIPQEGNVGKSLLRQLRSA